MSVTRFAARAAGPADRLAGFLAHLRVNGLGLGLSATGDALTALAAVDATDPREVRLALRALCTGRPEAWRRFDDLFDAYWRAPRARPGVAPAREAARPRVWSERPGEGAGAAPPEPEAHSDPGTEPGGAGRLVASRREALSRRDLRELAEPDLREAERIAERLARALRHRRSRRRRAARRGPEIDLRRTLRRIPARGGEPLDLVRRRRREPPLRVVALLDVSGSMTPYARVLLAFLRGLVGGAARRAHTSSTPACWRSPAR